MKKNIIAIAVAAAMVAPAAAMADTTLYGKFHVSYDVLGGDNASGTQSGFSSNSSRIGIKGSEKINDSLSIIYQYETSIDAGQNSSFSGAIGGQRNTFVGATGFWGTVITGRHDTPFKMMGRDYDLFGDTIGDSRNIISGPSVAATGTQTTYAVNSKTGAIVGTTTPVYGNNDTNWDLRPSQVIAYVTPDLMGFKAIVAYVNSWSSSAGVTGPAAPYNTNNNAWSLSAHYGIAGFGLDAAYEQHKMQSASTAGNDSQSAYRIGANYSIAGFKILGLYQDIKNVAFSNNDVKAYGVGAAYTFLGANTIKAQYYKADDISNTSNTGGDLWAVGYDYKLSKQTNVYAMYAQTSNSSNAMYTIMNGGHDYKYPTGTVGTTGSFAGGKSSAVSLGIEHKF
ncbi:porin [Halothiobacillus sp. DCM-1]|uniref:porin n=1 Tax=Halothiobacillus sp. DCM-1 TaxID=3112558 RepID=UPI003254BF02